MVLTPALVDLIVRLAPFGVEIILALLKTIEDLVNNQQHDVPTLAAVTSAIIVGVDLAHPGWTDAERARVAADAIAVYASKIKATAGA